MLKAIPAHLCSVCQLSTEFRENRLSSLCVILQTNKQTNAGKNIAFLGRDKQRTYRMLSMNAASAALVMLANSAPDC